MATALQDVNTILLEAMISKAGSFLRPTALIFDSGIGGLSVYQEIRKLLPNLHYIYAFDNAAFPYGEKSEEFIVERVLKIVTAIQQRHSLAIVIIACNTASIVTLPTLREHFSFPVVGVVPAIKPAAQLTRNGVIGLLATRATINRSYTQDLIQRFATNCKIELLGSSELVELAETKLHGGVVSAAVLKEILQPWLSLREPPDTVVLGCTHFPLLAKELAQILPNTTRMIDSGTAIARRTFWLMSSQDKVGSVQAENMAYCVEKNTHTMLLLPVLQRCGFSVLAELPLPQSFG